MWLRQLKIIKFTPKDRKKQSEQLVFEKQVSLNINANSPIQFYCIPDNIKSLMVGYLICTGISRKETLYNDLILTGYDGTITLDDGETFEALPSQLAPPLQFEQIIQLTATFQEKALLFKSTAICESAALISGNALKYFAEDLSGTHALYKVIGLAHQAGEPLNNFAFLTSCKIDTELITMMAPLGIHTIVSRTGVTNEAYELGKAHGFNLFGFARGRKVNQYL